MGITERKLADFKIFLDEENQLIDITREDQTINLPTAFSANIDFDCQGNSILTISCYADDIQIIKSQDQ